MMHSFVEIDQKLHVLQKEIADMENITNHAITELEEKLAQVEESITIYTLEHNVSLSDSIRKIEL